MKQLLLSFAFICHKLNIVYKKQVAAAVLLLERFKIALCTQIAYIVICEGVGCGIYDIHIWVELFHFAFNGGKKVCFSESRLTVDIKRVIASAGLLYYRLAGCIRKLIVITYYKSVKGMLIIACKLAVLKACLYNIVIVKLFLKLFR